MFVTLGINSALNFAPQQKKVIFAFVKSNLLKLIISSCLFLNIILLPTLFSEAIKYNSLTGKFLFSRTSIIFLPTLPVAPTIANPKDMLIFIT